MNFDYELHAPIGIDLGTTNSVVAYFANTRSLKGADVYTHSSAGVGRRENQRLIPSSIYLEDNGGTKSWIVGQGAEQQGINNPSNYTRAVKLKIGNDQPSIKLGDAYYSPVELTSEIVKACFRQPLAEHPERVPAGLVVSVPYNFLQNQNNNTKLAVADAVHFVFQHIDENEQPRFLGLIVEPVAAALYYAVKTGYNSSDTRTVLVFDLGGGTLDITLFQISCSDDTLNIEILVNKGHGDFGGEQFDEHIRDLVEKDGEFAEVELSERHQRRKNYLLLKEAKRVKELLSYDLSSSFVVGNLPGGKFVDTEVTREEFERILTGVNNLNRDYVQEARDLLKDVLNTTRLPAQEVREVLLIGGSSKIPLFRRLLENTFTQANLRFNQDDVNLAVAKGAALYAAYLLDEEFGHNHNAIPRTVRYSKGTLKLRTPHHLGVEKNNGEFSIIVTANSLIPVLEVRFYYATDYGDREKRIIRLPKIKVYQGAHRTKVSQNVLLDVIDLPELYTHGRDKDDIRIAITFEVQLDTITAEVFVPAGQENGKDLILNKIIGLK